VRGTASVLESLERMGHTDRFPRGRRPLGAALALAERVLTRADDSSPRFVVLIARGPGECNPDIAPSRCVCGRADRVPVEHCYERGESIRCANDDDVSARLASLLRTGIQTIVLGITSRILEENARLDAAEQNVMATASGLYREDPSRRYFDLRNEVETRAILEDVIVGAAYCQLRLGALPAPADRFEVRGESSGCLRRDPAHQDGWDWTADGQGVRLYGPTCSRIRTARDQVVLTTAESACSL
jgi:hypothetical protein